MKGMCDLFETYVTSFFPETDHHKIKQKKTVPGDDGGRTLTTESVLFGACIQMEEGEKGGYSWFVCLTLLDH